jgi:hypothetical protein
METYAEASPDATQIICPDWKQVAQDAWDAPSWREAALEYHRNRPPTRRRSELIASHREIWRAAGRCIRRRRDPLRTFLKWCDYSDVERSVALPIFKTIVQRELNR